MRSSRKFLHLELLETVIMPDSVVYIDRKAFSECFNLKNIRFSKNLKYIGEDAFEDTLWLNEQQSDFVIINNNILYKYRGHEKDVVIPEYVTTIFPMAFEDSVETITMSDILTSVANSSIDFKIKFCQTRSKPQDGLSPIEDLRRSMAKFWLKDMRRLQQRGV